jgi:hypothetical protein
VIEPASSAVAPSRSAGVREGEYLHLVHALRSSLGRWRALLLIPEAGTGPGKKGRSVTRSRFSQEETVWVTLRGRERWGR